MSVSDARLSTATESASDARPAAIFAFETILLVALAVPLAVAITALAWRSTLMAPINYNEGCNAYFVSTVLARTPLYFPPDALLTNNYPPLSFYLLAPLASLMGDAIFAGRLVAWLAFAAVAGFIVTICHRMQGDRIAALLAGMIFAGFIVINYDIYVGMNDPQMLAHAIMLCGLWVLLRRPDAPGSAVAAAVLMAVALFVKHNILALPLAVAVWLAVYNGRAAIRFVAAGAAAGALGLAACLAAFGPDFVSSLLAPRQYIPARAWRHAVTWLMPIEVPVLLAFLGAVIDRENRATALFFLYLLIALGLAWLLAGGSGVNFNLMFEVVIAFSLAAGQLVAALRRQPALRRWVIGAYAAAAVVNAGLVGTKDELLLRPWIAAQRAREAATVETVRLLAERPGPALCENPALCYWAGKPFELDPLNFEEGVAAGTKDEGIVLRRIASGYYTVIEFPPADPAQSGYLGPRLTAAAAEHYRVLSKRPDGTIVYASGTRTP
jgi:hypothetical protein